MNHALAHVGLRVPDLDASIAHAEAVLGVGVAERDEDLARLSFPGTPTCCLVLLADEVAGFDHMALLTTEDNVREITERARAHGTVIDQGRELDTDSIRLYAPNGLAVEVAAGTPASRNTAQRPVGPNVGSLDHLSFTARDHDAVVAFFRDVLGFRLSDSVGDQRHWLRCGPNHHTVAIFHGDDGLHHYAFETSDIRQLQRLGDLLAARGQNFVWGPGRHGLGANVFTYHLDPANAVLEVCCDMIQVDDEDAWVAQVWPADSLASAVMWGPPPPREFRELSIPVRLREGSA